MRERVGSALTRVVIGLGVAALVGVLWAGQKPAARPAPVDWDRTTCAHCGMLVSDPAFAGQLHLENGEVLHFDDPGCLLIERATRGRAALAGYLHHRREDAWLELSEAAFVADPATPMGHGFGVIRRGEAAGALTLEAATSALQRSARARHEP